MRRIAMPLLLSLSLLLSGCQNTDTASASSTPHRLTQSRCLSSIHRTCSATGIWTAAMMRAPPSPSN